MAGLYSDTQWDERGRPFQTLLQSEPSYAGGRQAGTRVYINPTVANQGSYRDDAKLQAWQQAAPARPGGSLFKQQGKWNPRTGQYDQGFNWDNLAIMGVGGLIGGPAIYGAFAGPGAVAPPAAATTGGAAAPTAATTASTVSGIIGPAGPAPFSIPAGSPLALAPTVGSTAAKTLAPKAASFWGGISVKDLIGLGGGAVEEYLNYRAASGASEAQLAAEREALDFAKKAYEEQNAKEQARFEATEARRAPYREASLASLNELKRMIGI